MPSPLTHKDASLGAQSFLNSQNPANVNQGNGSIPKSSQGNNFYLGSIFDNHMNNHSNLFNSIGISQVNSMYRPGAHHEV